MNGAQHRLAPRLGAAVFASVLAFAAPAARAQDPARRVAEAIEKTLQKHAGEVHRCFEKALADRLDVAGDVEVEVDVGPGGKVTAAKLHPKGGGQAPPALASCVETAARGFRIDGVEPGASVVLPFAFQGQFDQFAVKAADVPTRGPRAPRPDRAPPFSVKLLVDPVNVRAPRAALTLLSVSPKNRVALHRHPGAAKALYLLSGRARLLGPTGEQPIVVEPGTAIFVPPGHAHAIETLGKHEAAVFLQAFTPPGPEQVYRDPANAEARTAFEVVRDPRAIKPGGRPPVVVRAAAVAPTAVLGGKGEARILLDEKVTGSPDLSLTVIDVVSPAQWPRHGHEGAGEIIYVEKGGGTLEVGSEATPFGPETALHLPAGQPHALKIAGGAQTRLIQLFAPAGPEHAPATAAGSQENKKVVR